jgi:hypothetical protein
MRQEYVSSQKSSDATRLSDVQPKLGNKGNVHQSPAAYRSNDQVLN